tara:strand:- start:237 stop:398 length:162 start_codon:yes stop_codon:yes gene_type:complete
VFEIWSQDFHLEYENYEEVKLMEAFCRARKESYTIKYPDGELLECKFKKTTDA